MILILGLKSFPLTPALAPKYFMHEGVPIKLQGFFGLLICIYKKLGSIKRKSKGMFGILNENYDRN